MPQGISAVRPTNGLYLYLYTYAMAGAFHRHCHQHTTLITHM